MPSLKHDHDSAQRHDRHLQLVPATLDLTGPVPTIDGIPVWPIFGSAPNELSFPELLTDVLGYHDDEYLALGYEAPGVLFNTAVCRPADAAGVIADWPEDAKIFFTPCPTKGPARRKKGRGKAADVERLSSLWADLDVSEGKCRDIDTANAIIDDLSAILGTRPMAATHSGHGLHPYWGTANGYSVLGGLAALNKRWGWLVQEIAKSHEAKADSVFELNRMLRAPGTFNTKDGVRKAVVCHRDTGHPLTLKDVVAALDAAVVYRPTADDSVDGPCKYDPATWTFADSTCNYMTETIDGWANDAQPDGLEPGTGRHQWLLSQSVRLHCAKLLGCVTEADFNHAKDAVSQTFRHLRTTREPIKGVPIGEIECAWEFGEDTAATKTKTAARKELGDHKHATSADRSQASKLVDIALERYELGVTPEGKPFGYDPAVPHVVMDLNSRKFGLERVLARDYFRKFDAAVAKASVTSAMLTLEGMACEQAPTALHQRVAGDQNAVYIDMADEDNRVIEISGGDWRIVTKSPHKFRRTELTAAMPEPKRGDLKDSVLLLWKYVNIFKENYAVVLAILVDALINPSSAKPVVSLVGHSGTAKTSSGRCFVALIDPSTAALHSPPKDLQEWLTTASGSYVLGLDNLSKMPSWLSDAICCAATGDAVVKRQLYTDGDLHVVSLLRSVIFTGISFSGLRGDLSERLVSLDLKEITTRTPENELKEAWLTDRPVIFGGLLDLAAKVHAMLPTLATPEPLPRMADFGKVLLAVDEITGSDGMMQYRGRLKRVLADSATGDVFIGHLIDTRYDTGPDGKTSSQILADIDGKRAETAASLPLSYPPEWPRDPRTVTSRLKHNEVSLRSMGWEIDNDGGKNQSNAAKWFIHPPHEETR